jgi:nucleoside-diphosphate-sugar epimerase
MAQHFITGGAGFIGSHLADVLIRRGESVSIINSLPTGQFSNVPDLEQDKRLTATWSPQAAYRRSVTILGNLQW